jgi:hypothetical protein
MRADTRARLVVMTDLDGDARINRVVALLQYNLRTTLERNFGREGVKLSEEQVAFLAMDLADEALYAFSVDWAPRWVKPGEVHSWADDDGFHARCGVCLLDSPRFDERPTAQAWAQQHERSHRA